MRGLDYFFGAAVLVLLLVCAWLAIRLARSVVPATTLSNEGVRRLSRLRERKDSLGEELRMVELDHRLGRIADEEFRRERARLEPALIAVLAELDALTPDDELDEAAS